MGKIIFTVEGSTVGTVAQGRGIVEERAVSETDSGRIIGGLAGIYGMPASNAEEIHAVTSRWLDEMLQGAIARVRAYEREHAAVPPITVS